MAEVVSKRVAYLTNFVCAKARGPRQPPRGRPARARPVV